MLSGGLLHVLVGGFTSLFGWLLNLLPAVPSWVDGSAAQIQAVMDKAAALETWIPVVEAASIAKDVTAVWAAAAAIAFGRQIYSAITNRNA